MTEATMTASDLYATSQERKNEGDAKCHWCGAACGRLLFHDEKPPPMFTRMKSTARFPANPWICCGCWMWRRTRTTIPFIQGGFKDGQTPSNWSWWITEKGAWALTNESGPAIRDLLLKPPHKFVLMLREDGKPNNIHHAVVNDFFEIKANTTLKLTYGNAPMDWNTYELAEALTRNSTGKDPGVQLLVKMLNMPKIPMSEDNPEKRKQGRPTIQEQNYTKIKQVVLASGETR